MGITKKQLEKLQEEPETNPEQINKPEGRVIRKKMAFVELDLMQAAINYLNQRPHGEVKDLIAALTNSQIGEATITIKE